MGGRLLDLVCGVGPDAERLGDFFDAHPWAALLAVAACWVVVGCIEGGAL